MKITSLNDTMIALMSGEDRRRLGVQSSEEAQIKFIARSEKELQTQCAQLLRIRGVWFDQDAMHVRRTGTKSAPDFQFPFKGRYVAWEVKFGKGKLDEGQERARDAIIAQGGEWRLITNLEQAREHLTKLDS